MLRFPSLIPSPFYTGPCRWGSAGSKAPNVVSWPPLLHGSTDELQRGRMTTVADIRRTGDRELRRRRDRDLALQDLQNFVLACSCIGHISLPPIAYTQPLAFWHPVCQNGFSAIEYSFHSISYLSTGKLVHWSMHPFQCRAVTHCLPDNLMEDKCGGRRRHSGGMV